MADKTKRDHQPWKPGYLGERVSVHAPHGISQKLAMVVIAKALSEGRRVNVIMEVIESTISITDDAIHHMMRKR